MKSIFKLLTLGVFAVLTAVLFAPVLGVGVGTVMVGFGLLSVIPMPKGLAFLDARQAQMLFTQKTVAVYRELATMQPTLFLTSFFEVVETMTKEVSIAVQRGKELVSVDVYRHTDGKRNKFDKETQRVIEPPFHDQYLTANEHRLYDMVIAALADGNTTFFKEMTNEIADEVLALQYKIQRAIELQAAQVLQTGIVTLNAGTNIDFGRKAGSLIAFGAGVNWSLGTVDPRKTIENGCDFIRQTGKASKQSYFNVIMGSQAYSDFMNNTIEKARADIRRYDIGTLELPQAMAEGGKFHGEIGCGSYRVRLWTYPEFYDTDAGVSTPYIDPKKVIILPEKPKFKLVFAAVPQLIKNGGIAQKGAYLIQEFLDERAQAHEIHVKSAPICVPVAIDQIYTVQPVA